MTYCAGSPSVSRVADEDGIAEAGLLLRPALAGDSERWLEMIRDPDYQTYGAPAFVPLATNAAELAPSLTSSATAWADGTPGTLVVASQDAPEVFLGDVGWRWSIHETFGVADLGYGIHPDARGRGVARRALVALARWLLAPEGRGLPRVQLDHSIENLASCRVALAAAFEREGVQIGRAHV